MMATGETDSYQSTKIAPLILMLGYCGIIPLSILYKKNEYAFIHGVVVQFG